MSERDTRAIRDAFGAFMTGVTVVTTVDGSGAPRGFTANSFTSVSLDPPLLLVCIGRGSSSFEAFVRSDRFAVSVLAEDQREVAGAFARPGAERFRGVDWHPGQGGQPILAGAASWFECARHEIVEAGDHVILIGRVENFGDSARAGLGYARGRYVAPVPADAPAAAPAMVGAIVHSPEGVLLVRDGAGWCIPRVALAGPRGSAGALDRLVGGLGLMASLGFVFAVYEEGGTQHIVYRCEVDDQTPLSGRFHALDALPGLDVPDPSVAAMLARFVRERRAGRFGIYSGAADRGEVRALARDGEA